MGWSIGYNEEHQRDIGYGVPAYCDHPGCNAEIDRGVSHLCGFNSDTGDGCGLHFCSDHLSLRFVDPDEDEDEPCRGPLCEACAKGEATYPKKPEHPKWLHWKLTDESWEEWRQQNPAAVEAMKEAQRTTKPEQADTGGGGMSEFSTPIFVIAVVMFCLGFASGWAIRGDDKQDE